MNLQNQFLQITVQKWKAKLGIKKTILVFTDPKEWLEVFPHDKKGIKEAGMSHSNHWCIFINLNETDHKLLTELEDTVVHELLHLKYPKKLEEEIIQLTERYLSEP